MAMLEAGGGVYVSTLRIVASTVPSGHGSLPVTSSYAITASEKMSARASTLAPVACSGATYAGVPTNVPAPVRCGEVGLEPRSAGSNANEFVNAAVQPNTTYIFRVLGWANGPSTFQIISDQLLPNGSPNENGGTRTVGGNSPLNPATTPIEIDTADQPLEIKVQKPK